MRAGIGGILIGVLIGLASACLAWVQPALAGTSVQAVRLWPAPDYSRVALELSGEPSYKYFTLADPHRLVIDLRGIDPATLIAKLSQPISPRDPVIASLRAGLNQPGVTRLVAELKRPARAQVFTLKPLGDYGHRLVIDLYPDAPAAGGPVLIEPGALIAAQTPGRPTPSAGPVLATRPASPPATGAADNAATNAANNTTERQVENAIAKASPPARPGKADPAKSDYLRLVTVAIDPGHGGEDPGALGANGSREKEITLAVARRLKEHIDRQEGMRAVLTRDGDYFIPLHERVNKARRAQADLFVSIHADAFMKSTARGSSVFALSEKGATSAAARWLAKRENEADLVGGINIDVKDVYLKQTLIDLSQTATIADSLKLGRAVLNELGGINDLHRGHVEQAGFAVLKAPDIPSILVETAFISNPEEEKRLLDEDYQARMAEAIVTGIRRYFDKNPPLARNKVAQNF